MTDLERLAERWPGYTEQSWPERFAELDRRYSELSALTARSVHSLSRALAAKSREVG